MLVYHGSLYRKRLQENKYSFDILVASKDEPVKYFFDFPVTKCWRLVGKMGSSAYGTAEMLTATEFVLSTHSLIPL